jgi:hypothetical protein
MDRYVECEGSLPVGAGEVSGIVIVDGGVGLKVTRRRR